MTRSDRTRVTRPFSRTARLRLASAACLALATTTPAQEAGRERASGSPVAARVGDKTITEAELLWALPADLRVGVQRAARNLEELQRQAVERVFIERYVTQEAERRGIAREALYHEEIAVLRESFPEETVVEMRHLRRRLYEAKQPALRELVDKRLLEVTAEAAGLTVEQLLERQVRARVAAPTPAEVAVVVEYELRAQPDADRQKRDDLGREVTAALREVRIGERRQQYLNELRSRIPVEILIEPPPGADK